MKKIIIFFAVIIVILAIITTQYYGYKLEKNTTLSENAEYEKYLEKEIYGIDLATIINKTVDKNTQNKIEKDEQGLFIQNDTNSVEIEIYIKDNETKYKLETIYSKGTEQFVQYYGNIQFKCSKVEYHEKTGKIKYLLFEQQQS